ncbi:MAG: hypothetical protein ABEI75_03150 [Halobaculum sp.]
MAQRVTEHVRYERDGSVGVWTVENLGALVGTEELETAETHFRDHASGMAGCVVQVESDDKLGGDVLEHVNEQWTALAEETGIDRVAYVADGLARLALSNKNEANGASTRGFEDRDDALSWAADA